LGVKGEISTASAAVAATATHTLQRRNPIQSICGAVTVAAAKAPPLNAK